MTDLYKVFEKQLNSKSFVDNEGLLIATFQTKDKTTVQISHITTDDFEFIDENYDVEEVNISGIPKFIPNKQLKNLPFKGEKNG